MADEKWHTFESSSNLAEALYDEHAQTLKVRFKNGSEYAYGGVAKEAWDGLQGAESVGQHFNKHIRTADYKFTKVEKK